jgi:hypothetical protein
MESLSFISDIGGWGGIAIANPEIKLAGGQGHNTQNIWKDLIVNLWFV